MKIYRNSLETLAANGFELERVQRALNISNGRDRRVSGWSLLRNGEYVSIDGVNVTSSKQRAIDAALRYIAEETA